MTLKVLDLFSGIGGFSLGLEATGGFDTVAFCEIDEFPSRILKKHWPDVPNHGDVTTLKGTEYGPVDVVCGGYPCQPFSVSGERRGAGDVRHLWPEVARIMDTARPTWGIYENVYGHVSMGLDEVLSDLEALDYAAQCFVVPACAVNAPHRRDRTWIVANTQRVRQQKQGGTVKRVCAKAAENWQANIPFPIMGWPTEPAIRRTDDGIPARLDTPRLTALGNAVVPQIPYLIGQSILASYSPCKHTEKTAGQ